MPLGVGKHRHPSYHLKTAMEAEMKEYPKKFDNEELLSIMGRKPSEKTLKHFDGVQAIAEKKSESYYGDVLAFAASDALLSRVAGEPKNFKQLEDGLASIASSGKSDEYTRKNALAALSHISSWYQATANRTEKIASRILRRPWAPHELRVQALQHPLIAGSASHKFLKLVQRVGQPSLFSITGPFVRVWRRLNDSSKSAQLGAEAGRVIEEWNKKGAGPKLELPASTVRRRNREEEEREKRKRFLRGEGEL